MKHGSLEQKLQQQQDVEASRLLIGNNNGTGCPPRAAPASRHYGTRDDQNDEFDDGHTNGSKHPNPTTNDTPLHSKKLLVVLYTSIQNVYSTHDFPIHVILAIGLAKAFPFLGAEILKPRITGKCEFIFIVAQLLLHSCCCCWGVSPMETAA
jgi:hypothetical protein